jgi:hypothetical protein
MNRGNRMSFYFHRILTRLMLSMLALFLFLTAICPALAMSEAASSGKATAEERKAMHRIIRDMD